MANQLIASMIQMDQEDSSSPIHLYINCAGGSVLSGLALFDTINYIKAPVVTVNMGVAASMASFLLAAGIYIYMYVCVV
jgi:ATP-dependent Clp protease, protease subunit